MRWRRLFNPPRNPHKENPGAERLRDFSVCDILLHLPDFIDQEGVFKGDFFEEIIGP